MRLLDHDRGRREDVSEGRGPGWPMLISSPVLIEAGYKTRFDPHATQLIHVAAKCGLSSK